MCVCSPKQTRLAAIDHTTKTTEHHFRRGECGKGHGSGEMRRDWSWRLPEWHFEMRWEHLGLTIPSVTHCEATREPKANKQPAPCTPVDIRRVQWTSLAPVRGASEREPRRHKQKSIHDFDVLSLTRYSTRSGTRMDAIERSARPRTTGFSSTQSFYKGHAHNTPDASSTRSRLLS